GDCKFYFWTKQGERLDTWRYNAQANFKALKSWSTLYQWRLHQSRPLPPGLTGEILRNFCPSPDGLRTVKIIPCSKGGITMALEDRFSHVLARSPGWLDEAITTEEASRIAGVPVATLVTMRS